MGRRVNDQMPNDQMAKSEGADGAAANAGVNDTGDARVEPVKLSLFTRKADRLVVEAVRVTPENILACRDNNGGPFKLTQPDPKIALYVLHEGESTSHFQYGDWLVKRSDGLCLVYSNVEFVPAFTAWSDEDNAAARAQIGAPPLSPMGEAIKQMKEREAHSFKLGTYTPPAVGHIVHMRMVGLFGDRPAIVVKADERSDEDTKAERQASGGVGVVPRVRANIFLDGADTHDQRLLRRFRDRSEGNTLTDLPVYDPLSPSQREELVSLGTKEWAEWPS